MIIPSSSAQPAPSASIPERSAWAAIALTAAIFLLPVFRQPVGWGPGATAGAFALLAATRPLAGLLTLAALGPLGSIIFLIVAREPSGFHYHEALALAFISGWAARQAVSAPPVAASPLLRLVVGASIAFVLASAVVTAAIIRLETPDLTWIERLETFVTRDYLINTNAITATVLLIEGLVLVRVAAETCASEPSRRERVLRMLLLGAASAAALNVLRLVSVAAWRENAWQVFLTDLLTRRVNVHYADLNAAGSMLAFAAVTAAMWSTRDWRVGVPAAAVTGCGLWLTGSRSAMAAGAAALALAGLATLRGRSVRRQILVAAALAALVMAVVIAWRFYPKGRNVLSEYALGTRITYVSAGFAMAADYPVFGVGIGRFYDVSHRYLDEAVKNHLGQRENAHNYFVQILAELGVAGLALFLGVLGIALHEAWRESANSPESHALLPGLLAYLLTCLTGHPLLVAGAAYPFWLALGTASGVHSTSTPLGGLMRRLAVAGVLILTATIPVRIAGAASLANLETVSDGYSKWQREEDGTRYRWAGDRSTFYVAAGAISVRIPLKHGGASTRAITVVVRVDGREANRIVLPPDNQWRPVRVVPVRRVEARAVRIDLDANEEGAATGGAVEPTDRSGRIRVGRPVVDF